MWQSEWCQDIIHLCLRYNQPISIENFIFSWCSREEKFREPVVMQDVCKEFWTGEGKKREANWYFVLVPQIPEDHGLSSARREDTDAIKRIPGGGRIDAAGSDCGGGTRPRGSKDRHLKPTSDEPSESGDQTHRRLRRRIRSAYGRARRTEGNRRRGGDRHSCSPTQVQRRSNKP